MKDQIITNMILNNWYSSIKRASSFFDQLTDEEILKEVAPNRNRGIYLLGHLTAVHDMMLPLLDLGNSLRPELKSTFIRTPDNSNTLLFSVSQLRQYWTQVNNHLKEHFAKLTTEQWLEKHNSVSEEDFIKEPHRNKLNVVLGRTKHIDYHLGQLTFLKS